MPSYSYDQVCTHQETFLPTDLLLLLQPQEMKFRLCITYDYSKYLHNSAINDYRYIYTTSPNTGGTDMPGYLLRSIGPEDYRPR
jgi:hypothetical protein